MNGKVKLIAVILAFIMLTGCASPFEYPAELPVSTTVPPGAPSEGEAVDEFKTELFFVSEDGRLLSPETRAVPRYEGQSRAAAALLELEKGPVSPSLTGSVPKGLSVERVELSLDSANVYYSGRFPAHIKDWLVLRAAVAAVVFAAEGINSVNVFFDSMEPGYAGRALGALSPIEGALDVYLDNLRQEYEVLTESTEASSYESRMATLYFSDTTGRMLLGNNRPLYYDRRADSVTIIQDLLRELITGPKTGGLEPVLPAELTLAEEPKIEYVYPPESGAFDDEGTYVIDLNFIAPSSDFDERLAYGAIVLTLTGYLPQVKSVRISFTDEDGTVKKTVPGGGFSRDGFSDLVGHPVTIAFPDPDGSALYRVSRAVAQKSVYDAGARLDELFKGPADPGVLYPVFSIDDVKDVYIAGDTAVIDWKEGFSGKLTELVKAEGSLPKERREQLFIFSVINTVTEIPGLSKVLMLENGRTPITEGRIYLGNPLLRNPMLYIED
ncbi:MAG: Sporulation and spore germination [Firmicutes bacterium ADurb.Bin182]|nr:MAG: Sporulation and spore germination [Firmicutes bacterium ADurb.Bin182]